MRRLAEAGKKTQFKEQVKNNFRNFNGKQCLFEQEATEITEILCVSLFS